MKLVDSHCHLDFPVFDIDRNTVLRTARRAGVEQIVVPAVSRTNWEKVRITSHDYDGIYPAYGLHPMFIDEHHIEDCNALRDYLRRQPAVAVGECGLDFYLADLDREKQLVIFREQAGIAAEFDLPLIIHARKSLDLILKHIREYPGLRGVIHSFSGSRQQAEQCIKQGFKLGFGGPLTYPWSTRLRALVKELALQHILLESDAPDQPGIQHKGERNQPGYLPQTAEVIAEIKDCSVAEVAEITTRNSMQLFNLP